MICIKLAIKHNINFSINPFICRVYCQQKGGEGDHLPYLETTCLLSSFGKNKKGGKEIPQLKELRPGLAPEAVVSEVCKEFAIDKEAEIKKGMKRNKTREAISPEITASLNVKGLECIWQSIRRYNNDGL